MKLVSNCLALSLAFICSVSLSACSSSVPAVSDSVSSAPAVTTAPSPTAEPTPEPTAAPPASVDSFSAFESGLDSLGVSYDRLTMAAEYVGAETGFKYKSDSFTVELYQFDVDSDAYQQAVQDNAVTLDGFGTIPAYIHDGLAMLCTSGDLPQSVLDLFNSL